MRLVALLIMLLLIHYAFAQIVYSYPPVNNVSQDNFDIAPSLDSTYNSANATNDVITLRFGQYTQDLRISASMSIAGMSVIVDNSTYPLDGLSAIAERGYQQGHLTSLPSGGSPDFICNYNWFQNMTSQTAWRCDFDGDSCAEYENNSAVIYDINATFSFRNASEKVPVASTIIPVPSDLLNAMKDSSGDENLTVGLNGTVTFVYNINDRIFLGGTTCGDNYTNISKSLPILLSRNFTISGTKKLFFMRSPVLREQWLLSNEFDLVVFSQSPLYYAETDFNGAKVGAFRLRNYSIITDQYGLESIVSNKTSPPGSSENRNLTKPVPLENSNSSFLYVYEFNYSYAGAAAGYNNLSLSVNDSFLGHASFNDTLLSRYLSYNNSFNEQGGLISDQPARDSGSFSPDSLAHVEIGLGLVAFVILLAFVNFWLV